MILGLDLGSSVGVALGDPADGPPVCRTWELPRGGGVAVGPFMAALMTRLEAVMPGVAFVCFEAPFVPMVNGRPIPNQVRRAYGGAALVEALAERFGAECIEIAPVALKARFALHGRADKADMIRMAKRRGFTVANEHEADGAGCWWHAATINAPQYAMNFDPDFRKA